MSFIKSTLELTPSDFFGKYLPQLQRGDEVELFQTNLIGSFKISCILPKGGIQMQNMSIKCKNCNNRYYNVILCNSILSHSLQLKFTCVKCFQVANHMFIKKIIITKSQLVDTARDELNEYLIPVLTDIVSEYLICKNYVVTDTV